MADPLTSFITQDLQVLQKDALSKEEENLRFRTFLKQEDAAYVDEMVHALNETVSQPYFGHVYY